MSEVDRETMQIAAVALAGMLGKPLIALVTLEDGTIALHQHGGEGVFPPVVYPNARKAVARVMQIYCIGPVAPQTWPEEAEISLVDDSTHER